MAKLRASGRLRVFSRFRVSGRFRVFGRTRAEAVERARDVAARFTVEGSRDDPPFRAGPLEHPEFVDGNYDTGPVSRMRA